MVTTTCLMDSYLSMHLSIYQLSIFLSIIYLSIPPSTYLPSLSTYHLSNLYIHLLKHTNGLKEGITVGSYYIVLSDTDSHLAC